MGWLGDIASEVSGYASLGEGWRKTPSRSNMPGKMLREKFVTSTYLIRRTVGVMDTLLLWRR
jgi:hypothetical protein